jgi:tRNA(fMet)-specific endonuclease VapC
LLDTNICVALLRGQDPRLVERVKQQEPADLGLPTVVKAELLFGARKSRDVDSNLRLLRKLFSQFEAAAFDDAAAEHYGLIRAVLERQGTPIGANDLLIASTALARDLVLVTRNRAGFARVPGLRWEEW